VSYTRRIISASCRGENASSLSTWSCGLEGEELWCLAGGLVLSEELFLSSVAITTLLRGTWDRGDDGERM
jgi:hypothetical protein